MKPHETAAMSHQILCAAAVNPAMYLEDCTAAIKVKKEPPPTSAFREGDGTSTSLIWVVTGVPSLTKVITPMPLYGWSIM